VGAVADGGEPDDGGIAGVAGEAAGGEPDDGGIAGVAGVDGAGAGGITRTLGVGAAAGGIAGALIGGGTTADPPDVGGRFTFDCRPADSTRRERSSRRAETRLSSAAIASRRVDIAVSCRLVSADCSRLRRST
jgi:hypothetical protein